MTHKPDLFDQALHSIRLKRSGIRTEHAHVDWVKRFILVQKWHPTAMRAAAILTYTAPRQLSSHERRTVALVMVAVKPP
jgi:hypothetical protein